MELETFEKFIPKKENTEKRKVSLAIVGDCSNKGMQTEELELLKDVRPLLSKADIFLYNHEGAIHSLNTECKGHPSNFLISKTLKLIGHSPAVVSSSPSFTNAIKMSTTVATLANNHILDCGIKGIQETKEELTKNGILHIGAGMNLNEVRKPLILHVNSAKLGFLSFNDVGRLTVGHVHFINFYGAKKYKAGAASYSYDALKVITKLKNKTDFVIVSFHFGKCGKDQFRERDIKKIDKILEAGADIIVGHHPHILGGIIRKENKMVFQSVGDFVFNQELSKFGRDGKESIIVLLDLYENQTIKVKIHPIVIQQNGIPELVDEMRANRILNKINRLSRQFGTVIDIQNGIGYLSR